MASGNTIGTENLCFKQNSPIELKCDCCNSTNIAETKEGYVCGECGLVLEIQKLVYNKPYESLRVQHAPLNRTQIGFINERRKFSHYYQLNKLNKIQVQKTTSEQIERQATLELKRILTSLKLPSTEIQPILKLFKTIRAKLAPRTKYRNPEKLIPLIIYFYFKINNRIINQNELLEYSKITKKEFNAFKLQIMSFLPEYKKRERKNYILRRIEQVVEHFNLGMDFYFYSKVILIKFWEHLKNTTDDVIAGVVTSITSLCFFKNDVKINSICNLLGIRMSSIQCQVKKNIFLKHGIPGFKSLVKSSDLLREILFKLGVFKNQDNNGEENRIIKIKLSKGKKIFNKNRCFNYYVFILKKSKKKIASLLIKPFKNLDNNKHHVKNFNVKRNLKKLDPKLEIESWKFYFPRGPPEYFIFDNIQT
ncbi:MAG: TFIIB-type zinc ribbon-containing protein [Promethearchaeota archaeon]